MELPEIRRNIRKNKDILHTAGYGILVFIIWGFIKLFIYIFAVAPLITPEKEDIFDQIFLYSTIGFGIIDLIISIFIVLTCIREYKFKKRFNLFKKILFIVLAILAFIYFVEDVFIQIATKTFDVTLIFLTLSDLIYFYICLRLTISYFLLSNLSKKEKEVTNER